MNTQLVIDNSGELATDVHVYAAGEFGFEHRAVTRVRVLIGPHGRSSISRDLAQAVGPWDLLTAAITHHEPGEQATP